MICPCGMVTVLEYAVPTRTNISKLISYHMIRVMLLYVYASESIHILYGLDTTYLSVYASLLRKQCDILTVILLYVA